ncbi:HTH-type transcriptional repressor AseR [Marinobacter litoralis]|uniref:HTH-type transcriptional repressor AseR n=1 Tax=Marinobacter litoralis TaxID=187981 RepID=A0A3M2RCX0_9GAMM|nr:metalloregulator ArsR/SmtB family transcription factor [Marinobacter litoralis]RMJ03137.1 HTH-type transcriptional repressor AseR [Marinobacter litoralis]
MDARSTVPEYEIDEPSAGFSPIVLFRALSDELRLITLLLIRRERELCVCELTEAFEVSQPKVSRHLAILRDTGLVATERRGQWVYYSINPDLPAWVLRVLDETAAHNEALIQSPLAKLGALAERSAPRCS